MSGMTAFRAGAFKQSIGVNTHMSWQNPGSGYANVAVVEASLAYLGVAHVRDSIPYAYWTMPEYVAIAKTGVRFDVIVTTPNINIAVDLSAIVQLTEIMPGSVTSIEGANEFNINQDTFNGISSYNNPAWAQLFGPALYSAVKANPVLSGISVIAASMANAGAIQLQQEGNVSTFADSSNWHEYYGNGNQPGQGLAYVVAQAKSTASGKPVTITETGYYTAVNAMDWGGGGVNYAVQAILTINALLDAFHDGVQTTYLYELMNDIANPSSTDLEDSFGLFEANGTPKPAATAVHDLTTILADTGVNAATFTTGTLADTITGLPSIGQSMTFEKSDGTFELVIWNEPTVWNETTMSEVIPTPASVTVDLGAVYSLVKVYDPLIGLAPIQTLTDTSKLQLALASDPYIIEIEPLPTPQTYTPGAAGGMISSRGADTVLVGTGAVKITANGPTINIVGGPGALTYSGTATAVIIGATGAMNLILSGSNSRVTSGSGGMTVLDLVGGNVIQGVLGSGNAGITVTTTRGNDEIVTGDYWAVHNVINLGSGDDTVVANDNSLITGSSGNDIITANGGWNEVTTGTGSSVVNMNLNGVVTTNGRDTVVAAQGLSLTANGPATTVTGGNAYMWFSGRGSATISGGTGGGSFDLTNISNGAVTTAVGAKDAIQLGALGGVVTTRGTDTVQLGSGAGTVNALFGTTTVYGGMGKLNFIENAANATVFAGIGIENFTLISGQAGHSLTINNFMLSVDTLELKAYTAADVHTQVVGNATVISLSDHSQIILAGFINSSWHPQVG